MSSPKGQQALSIQQLSQLKKQYDADVEQLHGAHAQLRAAQAKFRECLRSISDGVSSKVDGKPILVPLTSSLYVPGKLADTEHVIVDVGTGFYVEKSTKDATKFYDTKVKELEDNIRRLEGAVEEKGNTLLVIEDVLREKVLSAGNASTATASA